MVRKVMDKILNLTHPLNTVNTTSFEHFYLNILKMILSIVCVCERTHVFLTCMADLPCNTQSDGGTEIGKVNPKCLMLKKNGNFKPCQHA